MKKHVFILILGILFGVVMTKAEIISWFRIQEMFRFEAFHMYGIIGTALAVGMTGTFLIKKWNLKDIDGNPIVFKDKDLSIYRYLLGGVVFGLGWALSGACPGPMYIMVGNGALPALVMIASAILGTWTYGAVKKYLPH